MHDLVVATVPSWQGWHVGGDTERSSIGDTVPDRKPPPSVGSAPRAVPGPVDARQIEPDPFAGCVTFRPPIPLSRQRCRDGRRRVAAAEVQPGRRAMRTEGLHVVHARTAGLDVPRTETTATARLCEGEGEREAVGKRKGPAKGRRKATSTREPHSRSIGMDGSETGTFTTLRLRRRSRCRGVHPSGG